MVAGGMARQAASMATPRPVAVVTGAHFASSLASQPRHQDHRQRHSHAAASSAGPSGLAAQMRRFQARSIAPRTKAATNHSRPRCRGLTSSPGSVHQQRLWCGTAHGWLVAAMPVVEYGQPRSHRQRAAARERARASLWPCQHRPPRLDLIGQRRQWRGGLRRTGRW